MDIGRARRQTQAGSEMLHALCRCIRHEPMMYVYSEPLRSNTLMA